MGFACEGSCLLLLLDLQADIKTELALATNTNRTGSDSFIQQGLSIECGSPD